MVGEPAICSAACVCCRDKMPEPLGIIVAAVVLVAGVEAIFLACRKTKQAGFLK